MEGVRIYASPIKHLTWARVPKGHRRVGFFHDSRWFHYDFAGMKSDGKGSIVAGLAICWLLNIAQLGIGWLVFVADERMLPAGYVLIGAIGLVQVGYVTPIWRLLRRHGKPRTAKGLLIAAAVTAVLNLALVGFILKP
jgi:hypothetical protein